MVRLVAGLAVACGVGASVRQAGTLGPPPPQADTIATNIPAKPAKDNLNTLGDIIGGRRSLTVIEYYARFSLVKSD